MGCRGWDVVDGLQRLSTIFQFVGIYRDVDEQILPPLKLEGTYNSKDVEFLDMTTASGSRAYTRTLFFVLCKAVQVKLIVDLINEGGFSKMRYSISNTAEYGDYRTGKRLITEETRKEMKKVLTEIQDGTFASEFLTEMSPKGGRKVHFLAERRMQAEHPIEKVGAELRSMMSWLKK